MLVQRGFILCAQKYAAHRSRIICRHYAKRLLGEVEYVKPTTLLITCMDSRIDPTRFIEMQPGSTFIIRNPGNFIPHSEDQPPNHVSTALAGLELTTNMDTIKHIIVCGHADCKAIQGLRALKQCCTKDVDLSGPLASWLNSRGKRTWYKYMTEQQKDGFVSVYDNITEKRVLTKLDPENELCTFDRLSQINVLQQMENISSYDFMKRAFQRGIFLHGMWLDVRHQATYIFDRQSLKFVKLKSDAGALAYSQI